MENTKAHNSLKPKKKVHRTVMVLRRMSEATTNPASRHQSHTKSAIKKQKVHRTIAALRRISAATNAVGRNQNTTTSGTLDEIDTLEDYQTEELNIQNDDKDRGCDSDFESTEEEENESIPDIFYTCHEDNISGEYQDEELNDLEGGHHDKDSDSDFEPMDEEPNDDDQYKSNDTLSLCQVLECKIKLLLYSLDLRAYLIRTQEHSPTRINTVASRTSKYFAFFLSKAPWNISAENFKKKNLRRILYHKENFLYEYCDFLSATKSMKPGSIVNILLDIQLVAKWLHYFADIKYSKDRTERWNRFNFSVTSCKSLWHKKAKRERRENTKSLEELVSEGKLPSKGLIDVQAIVRKHIPVVMAHVKAFLEAKVFF